MHPRLDNRARLRLNMSDDGEFDANNDPSVNQILPPLIIQEEEAVRLLDNLDGMLTGLEAAFR